MKYILFFMLVGFVYLFTLCSDSVPTTNQDSRAYEQDAVILSKFVSIDKDNLQYYFNPAKSELLSLIPGSYYNLLSDVSDENKSKFIEEMNRLNDYIKSIAGQNEGTIVFTTTSESYVKNLGKTVADIKVLNRGEGNAPLRATYGSLTLTGFNGQKNNLYYTNNNKTVVCTVNITQFGGNSYAVSIKESKDRAKHNKGGASVYTVSFTGYSSFYGDVTWTYLDPAPYVWDMVSYITTSPSQGEAVFKDY